MANLFLLDIDGALVDSKNLELNCYVKAVKDVLGIEMDTDLSHYSNLTDAGVLDELIAKHGISESRSLIHRKVESRYSELVQQAIKDSPETVSEVMGAKRSWTRCKISKIPILRSQQVVGHQRQK